MTDISGVTNYTNGIDYSLTNAQIYRLPGSTILDGDFISVSYQSAEITGAGLLLTLSNNFEVEAGGKVDLVGKGYGPNLGIGAGKLFGGVGSGGGHGGSGGSGSGVPGGTTDGTVHQPTKLGSGGSTAGGSGGGAAKIQAGNLARIDGIISMNGTKATNSQMGGGAGGSFWLTAPTFIGAGSISANGGSGELYLGGGGGGGRIAIYADTNLFAGDVVARGGAGWNYGGAGTIYLKGDSNTVAQVIIDNRGVAGTNTFLSVVGSYDLTVQGKAIVVASTLNIGNLTIRSNSWLMPLGTPQALSVTVTRDALIEPNSGFMFNTKGYAGGVGPGTPSFNSLGQGGGGHGGQGGTGWGGFFGASSGSIPSPSTFGSGGGGGSTGGGAGGGAVSLTVSGTLSLFGQITANGGDALASAGGGGSGGSIYLNVGTLAGSGKITADGGNGDLPAGGGGGGGRIALYYNTNNFTGLVSTFGGYGFLFGGAGTIFTKLNNSEFGLLLADNRGAYGAYTPIATFPSSCEVMVVGGAAMTNSGSIVVINSLYVGSNSYYLPGTGTHTIFQNVTVENTGSINADGDGSLTGGSGFGKTSSGYGSGGGYGGMGGALTGATSGTTYGSVTAPVDIGSAGGFGSGPTSYNYGGAGGGIVRMTVNGILTVNGSLSANGLTGQGGNSGGGSGGSINITATRLQGTGVISANGGVGESLQGGGGGGGRIAINYYTNSFTGIITARGGAGKTYGGAGTIFRKLQTVTYGEVTVDNGGNAGAMTPFTLIDADMLVSGGAVYTNLSYSSLLRSLFVGSNSTFLPSPSYFSLSVSGNMTIAAGGKVSVDGMGSSGNGAGTGGSTSGGGGAYGGNGGASSSGVAGGTAFGYTTSPTSLTSGGLGGYSGTTGTGGIGGGVVGITVSGNLLVDGKLTANGMSAVVSGAGGGAGGGMSLSVGRLMGSGIISVNGGAGEAPAGGGGGGGRMMITYNTNTFTGQITAFGGAGANYDGAGTISSKHNASPTTQWIIDNGGFVGAVTPVQPSGDFLIKGGAIVSNTFSSATCNSVYIATNSWFVPNLSYGSTSYNLTVSSNLVIEEGGGITSDGRGPLNGSGTGAGTSISSVGSGGGHGGNGGVGSTGSLGGLSHDSITTPTTVGGSGGLGSSGLAGAGGGYINVTVTGSLTNNGKITANGMSGIAAGSGGGAGGSILLNVGTLAGKGSISAIGGAGENSQAGGGGGGRISITYGTNNLTGPITAYGGAGWMYGGAGTIYLKQKTSGAGQLLLDNAGMAGAGTPLSGVLDNVTVANGSIVSFSSSGSPSFLNLLIKSNAVVTSSITNSSTMTLTIAGDLTIESGGRLHLDGYGYTIGSSTGLGGYNSGSGIYGPSGGGGGHGGRGGASITGAAGGAAALTDSASSPTGYGGAGGSYSSPAGPNGGGAIRLSITGNLTVDGALTANGLSGNSGNGGSAGGSIYATLSRGNLRGSGVIQANGGSGDLPVGGGGGGGRIFVSFRTNLFAGDITAFGGAGANYGGAGTIYLSTNNNSVAGLILDNGGNRGAFTPIGTSGSLSILNGAVATLLSSSTFDSLLIGSNGWLSYSNLFPTITVTKNTTIKKGGGILLAGQGSTSGSGLGTGSSSGSGGGGHGGYGGSGGGATGGVTHDSIFSPINNGGPGGIVNGTTTPGGGAFRFTTTQTLVLDGDINVNGGNATNAAAGGGAGGSVWINAGRLTGSGSIHADGGSGKSPIGGGGAGGMLALYYNTNTFTGFVSAHGGNGFNAGGAGTIYSRNNSNAVGTLLIDNAGLIGTNTPLVLTQAVHLVVQGGASVTQTNRQVLTSLIVAPDGAIVHSPTSTNLDLLVLQNALIDGVISADRKGLTNGPGSGQFGFAGSGGGYGGNGGDSSSSPGGNTYGSLQFPVDRGSGGGANTNVTASRTVGGGAIRLQVGGALTVNGSVSTEGGDGLLSNAGGGAGGSIWVTANSIDGSGSISVNGGAGEPSDAGGGGGGRIAVYTHTNSFAGLYSADGGQGWMNGSSGTIFFGTNFSGPSVVSINVTGAVARAVSSVDFQFDSTLDTNTITSIDFSLETPNGVIPASSVSFIGLSTVRMFFPAQTALGNYVVNCGPEIYDIFNVPMSAAYSTNFVIVPLLISGTVMDTKTAPLSGIELQPSGLSPVTTDTNGAYSVAVIPTWTGTITPDTNFTFLPLSRSYTNVSANVTNQNFVIITPEVMKLSTTSTSSDLTFGIFGVSQMKYQAYSSSNLVDWIPYGSVIIGSNSNISLTLPMLSTNQFFQFRLSN